MGTMQNATKTIFQRIYYIYTAATVCIKDQREPCFLNVRASHAKTKKPQKKENSTASHAHLLTSLSE